MGLIVCEHFEPSESSVLTDSSESALLHRLVGESDREDNMAKERERVQISKKTLLNKKVGSDIMLEKIRGGVEVDYNLHFNKKTLLGYLYFISTCCNFTVCILIFHSRA